MKIARYNKPFKQGNPYAYRSGMGLFSNVQRNPEVRRIRQFERPKYWRGWEESAEIFKPVVQYDDFESQVAALVNQERAKEGLPGLQLDSYISEVARIKAQDLRDRRYFNHQSPTYGSPFEMMETFGINYSYAGENIAKGQKSPQVVMDGWMGSPGHKDNILNKHYKEIGVGFVKDTGDTTYWVQLFVAR